MRLQTLRLLLLLSVGFLLAACSGADAQRATQLLSEVQAAQTRVVSATYDVRMTISEGSQSFTLSMSGGGYLKGRRAGDAYLSVSAEGLPVPLKYDMVASGGRGYVRMNGAWQSFPLPPGSKDDSANWTAMLGTLAQNVKSVDVRDGQVVAGETGTMIAGVVDTPGLVRGMAGLSSFAQVAKSPVLDEVAKHVGDMRVVLFISARTHLIKTGVINLELNADGKTIKLQTLYTLRSVNRPVSIPQV